MRRLPLVITTVFVFGLALRGQQATLDPAAREALQRATAEDHRQMMAQLGIRTLPPGPSATRARPITPITTKRPPIRFPICRRC